MTPTPAAPAQPQSYALPIVAFILSLVGVCICPTALVGLILGIVALVRLSKEPQLPGKGFAIAAVVIPGLLVPIVGIQAAIAIPNFLKFQARSKQSECRMNLKAMYTGQKSYFAEKNAWGKSFEEIGFQPERGNRYSYFLNSDAVYPVDSTRFPKESAEAHGMELTQQHLRPGANGDKLLMACVGNVDNDAVLDVWTIDENGTLDNVVNDVTQ
jgi:type IV pilus assembly protein PilA